MMSSKSPCDRARGPISISVSQQAITINGKEVAPLPHRGNLSNIQRQVADAVRDAGKKSDVSHYFGPGKMRSTVLFQAHREIPSGVILAALEGAAQAGAQWSVVMTRKKGAGLVVLTYPFRFSPKTPGNN